MRKTSYIIPVLFIFFCSMLYFGCDDSGTLPEELTAGQVILHQKIKLLPLDPVLDGYYNLFLVLTDSIGTPRTVHLGRFNVTTAGEIIDESGNPKTLSVPANDTIDLGRSLYSIISIDPSPVIFPGPTRILAGPVSIYRDSVTAVMLMNDTLAVGSSINSLLSSNSVLYHINTPTGLSGDCSKGIWFCQPGGVSSWNPGSALTLNRGWIYQGFVRNKTTGQVYSTGRFYDPEMSDMDGAGSCADTFGVAYSKPGQDWAKANCSSITKIDDGNHEAFVTLQPEGRSETLAPFVLKIYYQNNIITDLGCNRVDNLFTQRQNIPDVTLRITR
ncbi:MAG: hypothetical protein IT280_05610 [Ignavibacteria bacterium]|nr:hypothetical protein [Ignavibacteria bacterium]